MATRAEKAKRKADDEEARQRLFSAVPKTVYCELAQRQQNTLDVQARNHGLPFVSGSGVNLYEMIPALHETITQLAKGYHDSFGEGESRAEAERRLKIATANKAEIDVEVRKGTLADIGIVDECLTKLSSLLRDGGQRIEREYGGDVLDLYNEIIEDIGVSIEAFIDDCADERTTTVQSLGSGRTTGEDATVVVPLAQAADT